MPEKFPALIPDEESGYALAIFLVLLALLSATVATFSLTSIFSLRESGATRDREISYQMARAGLDVWMGNIREDWVQNHGGAACNTSSNPGNNNSGPPICSSFDQSKCGAHLGSQTRLQMRCCNYNSTNPGGGTGTNRIETHLHPWGWGSKILGAQMGDTVFLPSEGSGSNPSSGDIGYFRMIEVEDARGEFFNPGPGAERNCRLTPSNNIQGSKINVNTASYNHLREVVYDNNNTQSDTTDDQKLTHSMAKALVDYRTGQSQNISPGDDFGPGDEQYSLSNADTFASKSEVCDVLRTVSSEFQDNNDTSTYKNQHGCKQGSMNTAGGIWNDMYIGGLTSNHLCASIEGGAIECQGGSCSDYRITGRYRIRVKVERPSSCSKDVAVKTIETL